MYPTKRFDIDEMLRDAWNQQLDGWKEPQKWEEMVGELAARDYGETFAEHARKYAQFASPAEFMSHQARSLEQTVEVGYTHAEAEALCLCNSTGMRTILGQAAEEGSARCGAGTVLVWCGYGPPCACCPSDIVLDATPQWNQK